MAMWMFLNQKKQNKFASIFVHFYKLVVFKKINSNLNPTNQSAAFEIWIDFLFIPSQNDLPRWHLEGKRALKSIDFSLHQHSSSSSQVPDVWPNSTHPAEQPLSPPIVHLIPASLLLTITRRRTTSKNFFILFWREIRQMKEFK